MGTSASSGNAKISDYGEQFERLPNAPIVEAVIHWQAPAEKPLDKSALRAALAERFPEYECSTQQEFRAALEASSDGHQFQQRSRWDGYRLTGKGSMDRYIVQVKPDGVVFSRLSPYQHWGAFLETGLPFWQTYVELAEPPVIQRLGVRFINQIKLDEGRTASYFLKGLPAPPTGIALSTELFLYQDSFQVSGTPYKINWIRTVQPPSSTERSLFVDIDVSSDQILSLDQELLVGHLGKMRILKNRLFFSCMTKRAIQQFRKERYE